MRKITVPFCIVPNLPFPIVPFLPLFRLLLLLSSRLLVIWPFLSPQILSNANDYPSEVRHCSEADLVFQYTPCDQNNKRWLYAVPRSHNFLCSADSVPAPRHGLNCSVICPAGHFLEMHSQKCEQCKPGTYSLGDRLRYEQFEGDKLPDGFSVENSPADESFANLFSGSATGGQCRNGEGIGGWAVEESELRYRWTHCESTLSIALHLVRPGFAEFRYRISRDSRGLISLLRVRNAQCQSYGGGGGDNEWHGTPKPRQKQRQHQQQKQSDTQSSAAEGDIRVQRLALRTGQNLITWSVSSDPVLSTRMEMIRLIRLDLSGLAFTPECSACPAGTFADRHGAQQCEPCPMNTFSTAGARRCAACATHQWAEPRSGMCQLRPKCQQIDYHSVRPQHCNGTRRIYQRKIEPTVCLDEPGAYTALSETEQCPPCALGMYRNAQSGECQKCPEGEVSEDGKVCHQCPAHSQPAFGLFINRWDSFSPGVVPKFECEFVSADELAGDCRVSPAWISHGDRVESVQTRFTGVALEMSIHLSDGFYAPLHSGRVSADNPIALISVELELICEDDTCQFYIVQELDSPASSALLTPAANAPRGQLEMLALLNGTQPRRLLQVAAVTTNRPRRLVFAFMRSGTVLGRDSLSDRAVLYAINVTNTGDAQRKHATGTAHRCVICPRRDAQSGKCLPCPPGEYWANSLCRRCPAGSVLNPAVDALLQSLPNANSANGSSSASSPASLCVPCPPHFVGSADGFACEFSGHFDMDEEGEKEAEKEEKEGRDGEERKKSKGRQIGGKTEGGGGQRMHFDISALRETTLTARGIRVFSRDGQSYSHVFNVSLFSDRPVQCRDTLLTELSTIADQTLTKDEDGTNSDVEAMFCRWAAVPFVPSAADHSKNETSLAAELFVSSTIISRKLALLTRNRRFGAFHLSDDQLEYDSATPRDHLPLDVHFFFHPSSPSSSSSVFPSNCPNGTLGVVTVRCEPNVVAKPLARLSRHCPDGTCDGCLYHVLVETVHGCPLCHADDFREVRGECIDGSQSVHSIPSKHCALSGAQTRERTEPCRVILSQNVRLLLAVAILLIILLSLIIAAIYRRNKALEHRYMRLVEGRDVDQSTRTSCALIESDVDGSEEEEEEEEQQKQAKKESRGPRVFFSVRKGTKSGEKGNAIAHKRLGGNEKYVGKAGKAFADERTEFIAEEEESD